MAWRLVLFTGGRRYSRLHLSSIQQSAFNNQHSSAPTGNRKQETVNLPLHFESTPWNSLYRQTVCFITFIAVFFSSTPVHAAAPVYDPVFYYHHADHLGSGNMMTDRDGELVQHYQYSPFGREQFKDNTSAFGLSNRFTGQILDDDTGLYYYNARYYDADLGRFISAETIVQEPENPQTLNRYAYCGNNPLKYTDPSGHDFGITAFVVGVLIAAAVSATVAAVTGGNIAQAALTGAIAGGLTYGFGLPGAAASGAINAAITGGDIAKGALIGAVTAAVSMGISSMTSGLIERISNPLWQNVAKFGVSTGSGAIAGGIGAELSGGDFWQGAAMGAATGAAVAAISMSMELIDTATAKGAGNNGPQSKDPKFEALSVDQKNVVQETIDLMKSDPDPQLKKWGNDLQSKLDNGKIYQFAPTSGTSAGYTPIGTKGIFGLIKSDLIRDPTGGPVESFNRNIRVGNSLVHELTHTYQFRSFSNRISYMYGIGSARSSMETQARIAGQYAGDAIAKRLNPLNQ